MRRIALLLALIAPTSAVVAFQPRSDDKFQPGQPPAWVHNVTRMAFGTPGEVEKTAASGAQVLHTNLVWPYYPLRRDGGGLSASDRKKLKQLVDDCHKRGLKVVLGLP